MPSPLVECVPNFSEGRDRETIRSIVAAIESVSEASLLHIDAGRDANRTVVTFLGPPEAVAEAAFRAIAKAADLIDMRLHIGTHPRLGGTDVCPFVPLEGITLGECAEIARHVGRRVGDELGISVYFYEAAASAPWRSNLADIRRGEYEGLAEKMKDPRWRPDCGPARFNPRSGATVIGAREFLIAFNITLNTPSLEAAEDIAFELRERGRVARRPADSPFYSAGEPLVYSENHYPCGNCEFVGRSLADTERHCASAHGYDLAALLAATGGDAPICSQAKRGLTDSPASVVGRKVRRAGMFRCCKAIGWHVAEYGRSQVSLNLTNFRVTPPHLVYEAAKQLAAQRGLEVTGSELVGMIPYEAMIASGRYYLARRGLSPDAPPAEVLAAAVEAMHLDDLRPFDIRNKVLGLPEDLEL